MSTRPPIAPEILAFPPFQLDLRAGQLRRGATAIPLRPKTFAVLQYLAERSGELVTKRAILNSVWGNIAVSEDVVRLSVGELRRALGERREAPLIETAPRRGYRFVAPVTATSAALGALGTINGADPPPPPGTTVVGRVDERAEVGTWLTAAAAGRRQIGFVTGESGIGKTTLVDAVLADMHRAHPGRLRVARGQCVEQYGGSEPFLPILGALGGLLREADGAAIGVTLRDHAPRWFQDAIGLRGRAGGDDSPSVPRQQALHGLAANCEALAAETPLVLLLEDVHWCDYSTLDLLSVLAQSRTPARLLVLCTLRTADAIVRAHPVIGVVRELTRKGLCRQLALGGLAAHDIADYLAARFAGAPLPADLLPLVLDRSDGSPFFMVALVDHLLEQGLLGRDERSRWVLRGNFEELRDTISDGMRAIIEPRLERLSDEERRMLEAASVAGLEFAAHTVARATALQGELTAVEHVDRLCDALARRQEILRTSGDAPGPDGTRSTSYAFKHALYRQVIYQRLTASTRQRLHLATAVALEEAYAGRGDEVANQLAAHFERGGDVVRALRYRQAAAARAKLHFA